MRGAALVLLLLPGLLSVGRAEEPAYRGQPASLWAIRLRGSKRRAAVEELVRGGPEVVPLLVHIVRTGGLLGAPPGAFEALEEIGPGAREALPELIAIYDSGRCLSNTATYLVDAMLKIGPDSEELLESLRRGLRAEYPWTRRAAAYGLCELRKHDKKTMSVLFEVLPYAEPYDLWRACHAVAQIGPEAKRFIPKLEHLTTHDDPLVRVAAFRALLAMGKAGTDRVKRLFLNAEPDVQVLAAFWLGSRGEESLDAVPNMRKALREAWDEEVRVAVALGLGLIGPGAAAAIGDLRKAMEDKEEPVRRAAALALAMMGDKGRRKLEHALNSPKDEVVSAASGALALLEKEGGVVVPSLMEALGRTRSAEPAAEALASIGKPAVPALIEGLSSGKASVRRWCCYALGKISGDAKAAVPALEKLLEDKDPDVRKAAERALHWIRTG